MIISAVGRQKFLFTFMQCINKDNTKVKGSDVYEKIKIHVIQMVAKPLSAKVDRSITWIFIILTCVIVHIKKVDLII